MSLIKVLEVVSTLGMGGGQALVKDYVIHFNKKIIKPYIMCVWGRCGSANENILEKEEIEIRFISDEIKGWGTNQSFGNRLKKHLFLKSRILKVLNLIQPDIIHIHLIGGNVLSLFASYAKKNSIPIFYTVHTDSNVAFYGNKHKEKLKKILNKNTHICLIALDKKSEYILKQIFPNNRIVQINNAIDQTLFTPNSLYRNEIREKLKIPKNALVIGHVGRFISSKNHKKIVDIFFELKSRVSNAYLVLVGEGELLSDIQQRVRDKKLSGSVIFLSNRNDVYKILNCMDIFIFPSKYEGFPISLIEAQSVGLKCIISDCISPECILTDKTSVIPLDAPVEKWVNSIENFTGNTNHHKKLGDYDINIVVKKLEDLYLGDLA